MTLVLAVSSQMTDPTFNITLVEPPERVHDVTGQSDD